MFILTNIILLICLTYLPNFLETAEVLHCLPSYWSPYLRWHSIFKTNSPQTFRAISSRCRKVHFRLPAALARAPWLLDGNPALKAIAPGCNKVIRGNCSLPSGGNPTWGRGLHQQISVLWAEKLQVLPASGRRWKAQLFKFAAGSTAGMSLVSRVQWSSERILE